MEHKEEKLLTNEELAEEMNVTTQTIRNWRKKGLPVIKDLHKNSIRVRVRYSLPEIKEWLEKQGRE